MPDGGGRLFVGNGIAYAAALNREAVPLFSGGFATADVSNPDHLTLISGSDIAPGIAATGEAFRANGSGVGVQIGLLRTIWRSLLWNCGT